MNNHKHFMQHCIQLAKEAMSEGNPPVGSVVVKDGLIVGQGIETGKSRGDITYHAEIEAIRDAVSRTKQKDLSDCSLYTTHEPCIMCSYVIRHHAIKEVIIGANVRAVGGVTSNYPILIVKDIEIWNNPPIVIKNVCSEDCKLLTEQYKQFAGSSRKP